MQISSQMTLHLPQNGEGGKSTLPEGKYRVVLKGEEWSIIISYQRYGATYLSPARCIHLNSNLGW